MANNEQLGTVEENGLEVAKDYFYAQFQRNHGGEPGDYETRKAALTAHLRELGQGQWFGGYPPERIDIYTAPEGGCLAPAEEVRNRPQTTRHIRDDGHIGSEEEGGRQFEWAINLFSPGSGVDTIFQDSETGEIGVYDQGWTSTYTFQGDQERALTVLENILGKVFYPSSETRHHPTGIAWSVLEKDSPA